MNITFGPKGILQIDNARIIYRNFEGRGDKFNREGDRNFALVIEDAYINKESNITAAEDIVEILRKDVNRLGVGWNVKVKPRRDEDETPLMFLPVKLKFTDRGPSIYLRANGNMTELDEESVEMLDKIDILNVDLDIRPYDDEINGRPFRAAYVHSICVTQDVDRFKAKYED